MVLLDVSVVVGEEVAVLVAVLVKELVPDVVADVVGSEFLNSNITSVVATLRAATA